MKLSGSVSQWANFQNRAMDLTNVKSSGGMLAENFTGTGGVEIKPPSNIFASSPINAEYNHYDRDRDKDFILLYQMISDSFADDWEGVAPSTVKYTKQLHDTFAFYYETLSEEDWENFSTGAIKAGDDIDLFLLTANKIFGRSGGSEKDLSEFLEFSANLSKDNLNNFLHSSDDNFGEMFKTMEIASMLRQDDDALSAYLETANLSDKNLDKLNTPLHRLIQKTGTAGLSGYLSAAAKAGNNVVDFVTATHGMKNATRDKIAVFVNQQLENEDLDNFVQFASFANEKSINEVIDFAQSLSGKEKSDFLKSISMAKGQVDQFMRTLGQFASDRPDDLSNFLTTAANAEKQLGAFLDVAESVDLKFTSSLSLVDTINFLEASKVPGTVMDDLTRIGRDLTGEDKSLFFYAAVKTKMTPDQFFNEVEGLNEEEKSVFLLKTANEGKETQDSNIYMKGVLSDTAYRNFKTAASHLEGYKAKRLEDAVLDLSPQDRVGFLEAATVAEEDTESFVFLFQNTLSYEAQKGFLDVSSDLSPEKKNVFVRNMVKAEGKAEKFIGFLQNFKEDDFTGHMVDNFLLTADQTKNSIGLENLIDFSEKLTKGQKETFLLIASQQKFGHDLPGLINMGEGILSNPYRYETTLELRDYLRGLSSEEAFEDSYKRCKIGSFVDYLLNNAHDPNAVYGEFINGYA